MKLGRHDVDEYLDILKYDIAYLECFLSYVWSKYDRGW